MKRIAVALLVVIMVISSHCFAEIDLSGMSFDELIELKEKINMALWECEEWQEVVVPQGVYEIGVDIPAGKWSISPADSLAQLLWGTTLNEDKTACSTDISFDMIISEDYKKYDPNEDKTHVDYELRDGQYITVKGYSVIFRTYTGKDLGFTFK